MAWVAWIGVGLYGFLAIVEFWVLRQERVKWYKAILAALLWYPIRLWERATDS